MYQQRDKEVTQVLLSLCQEPKVTIINKQITAMVQTTKTTDEQIEEMIQKGEQEILAGIEAIEGLRGEWSVRLAPRRLLIGLVGEDKKMGPNCIEISFGRDFFEEEDVWEAQIGNRGSFDLTPGNERLTFYTGAGMILGSDFIQGLKERLNGDFMSAYNELIYQNR